MKQVLKYGRVQLVVPDGVETATIIRPDGVEESALTFRAQPSKFLYDEHGYEQQEAVGEAFTAFRYTPTMEGVHRYIAGEACGEFACIPSDLHGFVQVSPKDCRYFATDDGHAYVPVGPNLCILRELSRPASKEHFAIGTEKAWLGLGSWRRWIKRLSENKVNYVRIWLSTAYFDARTRLPGVHDLQVFERLDAVMEMLRAKGIRVKMCIDHIRMFNDPTSIFNREQVEPLTGKPLRHVAEWVKDETWRNRWLEDAMPYIARYQNDPVVMAWELWNEHNCVGGAWEDVYNFIHTMLDRVKALSPKNLVMDSLGSYDRDEFLDKWLKPIRDMDNMPVMQIHRYLDQGGSIQLVREDPLLSLKDAIERVECPNKPVVINETGAVEDCHTGPFRFYCCDDDGILFHDFTYVPFFCGAAASGHIWHWEYYIEPKNLWKHFRPFVDMLEGIEVDEEQFVPSCQSNEQVHVLRLEGKKHCLIYVRNRSTNWQRLLRDGEEIIPVNDVSVAIPEGTAKVIWLMNEQHEQAPICGNGQMILQELTHGCIIRVDKA